MFFYRKIKFLIGGALRANGFKSNLS